VAHDVGGVGIDTNPPMLFVLSSENTGGVLVDTLYGDILAGKSVLTGPFSKLAAVNKGKL